MRTTDWDSYYSRPYKTATFSRSITTRRIRKALESAKGADENAFSTIFELGGANSCFLESLCAWFSPRRYLALDKNRLGLEKLRTRLEQTPLGQLIVTKEADLLSTNVAELGVADLVLSFGLIEHFSEDQLPGIVDSHFHLLKPEGLALITFPTPTWLYRITRWIAEKLGLWIFHDETPLPLDAVQPLVEKHGTIVHQELIWPIFLTQYLLVIRKAPRP